MPGGIHPSIEDVLTWPAPNYVDPPARHGAIPIIVFFTTLTLVIVIARLFVRGIMQRNMGVDDWTIMLAMVPLLGLSVGACLSNTIFHFGRHVWDVKLGWFVDQRKLVFANEICYVVSSGLTKLSILLFYRRLGPASISKVYLWVVYASLAFVAAYTVQCTTLLIFNCTPVSDYWNQLQIDRIFSEERPKCVDEPSSLIANTALSFSQDLVASLVPTYLFWTLTLEKRQKMALAVVFALGYVTCGVGAARLWYIHHIFYETYDVPYYTYDLWTLTVMEVLMGAMCASAPPLKVFFRRLAHVRRESSLFSYDPFGRGEGGEGRSRTPDSHYASSSRYSTRSLATSEQDDGVGQAGREKRRSWIRSKLHFKRGSAADQELGTVTREAVRDPMRSEVDRERNLYAGLTGTEVEQYGVINTNSSWLRIPCYGHADAVSGSQENIR